MGNEFLQPLEESMAVEAIGGTLGQLSSTQQAANSITQDDFIQLFVNQLNFQDPLEPLDNREFLAQMVEFSAVTQREETNTMLEALLESDNLNQSLSLLGKSVTFISQSRQQQTGTVGSIGYESGIPILSVSIGQGEFAENIRMSQIQRVD
jgi:flagellar basal-body rod modification protein FlgD